MSALGRLVASVILDNSEFLGGVENSKRAAASMATDIDKSLKQVENTVKGTLGTIAAAFAAGFGVAALKDAFDTYTKNAAALTDLAAKAGTTAEKMSQLSPIARLSGTSMDELTAAMEKLSKGIVNGLTKETASANKALDFLGVSARDSSGRLKDSATLMEEIAPKLALYADGIAKTTLLMDLHGKAGANLAPIYKDLAEFGVRNATVTAQQSLLAKQYEQDLVRLGLAKSALTRVISQELLPVADAFVRALLEMTKRSGGLKDQVDALAASGGIRDFAMSAVRGFALLLNAGDSVVRLFDIVGESIGAMLARASSSLGAVGAAVIDFIRGNYAKAWDDLKQGSVRDSAIIFDAGARIRGILEKPLAGDAFVNTLEGQLAKIDSALNKNTENTKRSADGYKAFADATKNAGDAVDGLVKSLDVHVAKMTAELDYMLKWGIATKETNLATTDAQLKLLSENGVLEAHAKALGMSAAALREMIRARAAELDVMVTAVDLNKQYIEALKKMNEAEAASIEKIVQQVQVEKDKIATMGMSADQITRYTIRQLEAKKALAESTEGADAYVKMLTLQIAKLRDLADAQGQYLKLEEQGKLWTDLSSRAGKFFGDLIVNGSSAFGRLRQELASFAQDVIAFFTKRFVLQMVAGVAGAAGAADAQAGALSALNGLSSANSAGAFITSAGSYLGGGSFTAAGGAGTASIWGTGSLSGAGDFAGAGLAGLAGDAALAAGATDAFAASLAEAIPYIGWIIAIGAVLYTMFGPKPGAPKTGGSFLGSFDAAGTMTGNLTSGLDRSRYLQDETRQDPQALAIGRVIGAGIAQTVRGFGGTTSFQSGIGWNMDPGGNAPSMVSSLLRDSAGRDLLVQSNRNVGRDAKDVQTEIELQTKRTLLAALQNSDIPAYLANVFKGVDALNASAAAIDSLLAKANALKSVFDMASRSPTQDLAAAVNASASPFQSALTNNDSVIRRLMTAYDGSTASAQNLATATTQYYNAQLQLLIGLRNAKTAIDDMFGGTVRGIQLSVLDKQGQYNFYQTEASDLQRRALTSNDPATIQRYAQQINQNISAAFALLSPEDQRAQSVAVIDRARASQAAIDARIERIQKDGVDAIQKTLNDLKALIGAGADAQTAAAATQVTAANAQLVAANTPVHVIVTDGDTGQQLGPIR